jgi:hypothetical protein
MHRTEAILGLRQFPELLRGEAGLLRRWIAEPQAGRAATSLAAILVGAGLYGAAMGCWRSPLQALFVGIKFPLIILLVAGGNALLNAMLAPLLGLNIGLRQSFLAILASFNIAAAILGSFSPLVAFVVWNSPPMSPDIRLSGGVYSLIMLGHVAVIAFAGIAANLRLFGMLRALSPSRAVALRVLAAWLAGNLFLGSQLCWIFRPFIGSPTLPVQFIRESALQGNFYETVLGSFLRAFKLN